MKKTYPKIEDKEIINSLRLSTIVGAVNMVFICTALIVFMPRVWPECHTALICSLTISLVLSNLLVLLHYKRFKKFNVVLLFFYIVTVFILTAILHYAGDLKSAFTFIYLTGVIMAAPIFSLKRLIILISLSIISYFCLISLEGLGIIPTIHTPGIDMAIVYFWLLSSIGLILTVAIGVIIGKAITQRRQKEFELARARDYTDNIIKSMIDTMLVVNPDGKIQTINPATVELLGYKEDELIGQPVATIFAEEEVTPFKGTRMKKLIEEGSIRDYDMIYRTKSGEKIPVSFSGSVMRDKEGELVGIVGIARDMREIKRLMQKEKELGAQAAAAAAAEKKRAAELDRAYKELSGKTRSLAEAKEKLDEYSKELERSNKELEQFAYVASHDLQEPLRMVRSYTQLLANRYKDKLDSDAEEFIAYAVDGATRMQTLINDLLTYSRVGTRGRDFELTDCSVVLDRTLVNLEVAIKESSAVVTHDALPTVMADSSQLIQLFQNLIGNAIKFRTEKPPRVHVSAEQKGPEWVFSVRDNGIGIDPNYAGRIFKIFQRLHSRTKYPGTGIGLAVCKRIVERHSGRIWVESETGKGSIFYFTVVRRRGNNDDSG